MKMYLLRERWKHLNIRITVTTNRGYASADDAANEIKKQVTQYIKL